MRAGTNLVSRSPMNLPEAPVALSRRWQFLLYAGNRTYSGVLDLLNAALKSGQHRHQRPDMEDARYFRAKAARCLRMAGLLSDKRAAENLRDVAAASFSRAVEMETGAQPKINGSVVAKPQVSEKETAGD
jgi:hypothetical protein